MPTSHNLKAITNIGEATLEDQVLAGVQYFFNWGLLNAGAFTNVTIPSSGQYPGTPRHQLRCVDDPNYTRGQVWESFRKEWVWESGVEFNTQPISVSGVKVGNTFQPGTGVGVYKHKVDYRLGRIVFDAAISPTSVVTASYSYRWCPVSLEDEPWFRDIQFRVFHSEDGNFLPGSGQWSQLAQNRLQLPAVVLEVGASNKSTGLQLGGGQIVTQQVLFNILTENPADGRKLRDMIKGEVDRSIFLFNLNLLAKFNRFPLNADGSLNTNRPPSYPQLVAEPTASVATSGFLWRNATFTKADIAQPSRLSENLYWSVAKVELEVEMPYFS